MTHRFFLVLGAVGGLVFSAPLVADDQSGDAVAAAMPSEQPGQSSVNEVANPEVYYQAATEAGAAALSDDRAKTAWLDECRRRANLQRGVEDRFSKNSEDTAPSDASPARAVLAGQGQPAYDYCQAYLDDYYRNYSQPETAYSYGSQSATILPQPAQLTLARSAQVSEEPYEEVITEEYVPVYSRSIPRRTVNRLARDKRVRIR
jgi:hypothetical protein